LSEDLDEEEDQEDLHKEFLFFWRNPKAKREYAAARREEIAKENAQQKVEDLRPPKMIEKEIWYPMELKWHKAHTLRRAHSTSDLSWFLEEFNIGSKAAMLSPRYQEPIEYKPHRNSAWVRDDKLGQWYKQFVEAYQDPERRAELQKKIDDFRTANPTASQLPKELSDELNARPPPNDWLGYPDLPAHDRDMFFDEQGWTEKDLEKYAYITFPEKVRTREQLDEIEEATSDDVLGDPNDDEFIPDPVFKDGERDFPDHVRKTMRYWDQDPPFMSADPEEEGFIPPNPFKTGLLPAWAGGSERDRRIAKKRALEQLRLTGQKRNAPFKLKKPFYHVKRFYNEDGGPFETLTQKGDEHFEKKLLFEEERLDMLREQRVIELPAKILSSQTMNSLYDMHISDPEFYDVDRLSVESAIRPDKVSAILQMVHRKKMIELDQNTWHNKTMSYLVEKNLEQHVTDTLDEKSSEVYTPQSRRPVQTQFVMDDQFDETQFAQHMLELQREQEEEQMRIANRSYFKSTDPPAEAGYATPVILIRGTRTEREIAREKRKFPAGTTNFNLYEINHDPTRNDFTREIVVTEIDGTRRGATWEERRTLLTKKVDNSPTYKRYVKDVVGEMYNQSARDQYFIVQKNIQKEFNDMKERHKKLPPGDDRVKIMMREFYFSGAVPIVQPKEKLNTEDIEPEAPWWAVSPPEILVVPAAPPKKKEEA